MDWVFKKLSEKAKSWLTRANPSGQKNPPGEGLPGGKRRYNGNCFPLPSYIIV